MCCGRETGGGLVDVMTEWITNSPRETFDLAYSMAESAVPGEVFALCGDLGAGKTLFAKGFAAGLGITEPVTSPTFTIVCEYRNGRLPLFHFDVYRIDDEEELFEIGFEEYLYGDGVCLIEWADRVPGLLPEQTQLITIRRESADDTDVRRIQRMK